MMNPDDRNYDFQEMNPLFSYNGSFTRNTIEGAYKMFSALFEQAEAGKAYRVHVGNTAWVVLERYLFVCSEAYEKPAQFIKNNDIHSRRNGYAFVQF